MSDDLYYNFDSLSGKTGEAGSNKTLTLAKSDLPNVRWGKIDYIAVSTYIVSSSGYFLVIMCKGGNSTLYFCIPLQQGGSSDNSLESLIDAFGTDKKDAQIQLNSVLPEQSASVYSGNYVILSTPILVNPSLYNSLTNKTTSATLPTTGTPVNINVHQQDMDWMIDCELVGEEGTTTEVVSKGITDLNSAVFAIIVITIASSALYVFVPNYMNAFYQRDAQEFVNVSTSVWVGSILAMISITIWGFLNKKVMLASLMLFGMISVVTAGSFSAKSWAANSNPPIDLSTGNYGDAVFANRPLWGIIIMAIIAVVFAGISNLNTTVEYTYFAILSFTVAYAFVGNKLAFW